MPSEPAGALPGIVPSYRVCQRPAVSLVSFADQEDNMAFRYLTPYRSRTPARGAGGASLFDLNRQINRMFDDLFKQEGDSGFYARAGMSAPAMDIHQTDEAVEITAELPGVKEEDVDLSIEDGILTLRGEKKSSREVGEGGYRERTYGSFERRITLPGNIDEEACSADFADGVLTITLPKREEQARGRKIPLGTGRQRKDDAEGALIEHDEVADKKQSGEQQPSDQKT
jgi:HSP20 family protein